VKTIAKGIANAVSLGGAQTVFIGEGNYPEKVTLVEGVGLRGGYQCGVANCSWSFDPTTFASIIVNQDGEGVLAGATITRKTIFEALDVTGKGGVPTTATGNVCMSIDGGSPTVQTSTFHPGAVSGRAVGISVISPTNDPAGGLIDSNTINGGSSTTVWIGVSFDRKTGGTASAIATVSRNTISAGSGATSLGIAANSSAAATLVDNNTIVAGTSTGAGGSWGIQTSASLTINSNRVNLANGVSSANQCAVTALCGGIASLSSSAIITNNVVFGAHSNLSTAVLLSEAEGTPGPVVLNANYLDGAGSGPPPAGGTPTSSSAVWMRICTGAACGVGAIIGRVRNNILAGGNNASRYGIYEEQIASRTAHPDKLDSNDFFFAVATGRTDVLYHLWDGSTGTDLTTLGAITAQVPTSPAPSNLFNLDPGVNATFHLPPGSPLIDKGTATDAPPKDFDNETRPKGAGIDIGPDEAG
jgi:hypothetical protein